MKSSGIRAAFGAAILIPAVLVAFAPVATAETQVATALKHMVVEEKLARDVYSALGDQYSVRQFDQIASSESRHLAQVRTLLTRYGITDPTRGDAAGVFDDPSIQKLYDDLVEQGDSSLAEAARSGISIEELDIADLRVWLAKDLPADVDLTLSRLLDGSYNHLNAFTRLEARA